MNDSDSNFKMFEDHVCRRCEEILFYDEKYQKFSSDILDLEIEFKKSLSLDQIKEYNKMEKLNMESIAYAATCIYKKCLAGIENLKKIG